MTAEEKMRDVEAQVVLARRGEIHEFNCPYCGENVEEGATFCCKNLMDAVKAVLDRQDIGRYKELADRIAENATRN